MLKSDYKAWWMGEGAQNTHNTHNTHGDGDGDGESDGDGEGEGGGDDDGDGEGDEDDEIRYLPSNLAVQALNMALEKGLAMSGAYTRHLVAALDLVSI